MGYSIMPNFSIGELVRAMDPNADLVLAILAHMKVGVTPPVQIQRLFSSLRSHFPDVDRWTVQGFQFSGHLNYVPFDWC